MFDPVDVPSGLATCQLCGLTGIPLVDGQLAAHQWQAGRYEHGHDVNGYPTGRWVGGCVNLDPNIKAANPAHCRSQDD